MRTTVRNLIRAMCAVRRRARHAGFALCFIGASVSANAAAGWTDFGAISEFNQNPSTTPGNEMMFVRVSVTVNPSDPGGCFVRDGFYFAVTTDLQKRLFAILLTAKTTGQNVKLYVTNTCHLWGFAEIQGIVLQ